MQAKQCYQLHVNEESPTSPPQIHAPPSLYQGLKAIWDTEFPKTCPKCGRVYSNFDEYLFDTYDLREESGLMGYEFEDTGKHVGLYRNCACGSTIMIFCMDRRDITPNGELRRKLFGEMLERLVKMGMGASSARSALLKSLRGSASEAQQLSLEEFARQTPPSENSASD